MKQELYKPLVQPRLLPSKISSSCIVVFVFNLFIMGASTFPQQPAYNPTGPVGALAYWAADAITAKYLKNPGPLVHA
jgi:choline dehydrogenase-like flavoprotein